MAAQNIELKQNIGLNLAVLESLLEPQCSPETRAAEIEPMFKTLQTLFPTHANCDPMLVAKYVHLQRQWKDITGQRDGAASAAASAAISHFREGGGGGGASSDAGSHGTGKSEVCQREPIKYFLDDKLRPIPEGDPRYLYYQKVKGQFALLATWFAYGRPIRGANNCTYLSFGIGYLKHISHDPTRIIELLQLAQKYHGHRQNQLEQFLEKAIRKTYTLDLECASESNTVMQELVVVLRREVANYIQENVKINPQHGRYEVLPGRFHPYFNKTFPDPQFLRALKQAKVPSDQIPPDLDERLALISTPGSRASEELEYEALARRFNCPFVDIFFKAGRHVNLKKLENISRVVSYPLPPLQGDERKEFTIEHLVTGEVDTNKTFAILCKNEGHSEVLFRKP